MARYQNSETKRHIEYPMGSVSRATMRPEDLIPEFVYTLEQYARVGSNVGDVSAKTRKEHRDLCREINARIANGVESTHEDSADNESYFQSEEADYDLEALFDALDAYAGPYFYFGAHPGDGSDYGFWLSEEWDQDFMEGAKGVTRDDQCGSLKVNDLSEVPFWFRGEVAVVNDHGNVTLYVRTARQLREIWSLV